MPFDYSVSAAGIVRLGDRILAVRRRDNGQWHIPGGVVERGESLHEACAREILEETGVQTTVGQLVGVYNHQARGILALVFAAHPVSVPAATLPTEESAEVAWLTFDECKQRMSSIFYQRVEDGIRAMLAGQDRSPFIREHNGVEWL